MKIGQTVYFVREIPPRQYNYRAPEVGEIIKFTNMTISVNLYTTGVTHKFRVKGLEDTSYTYHKLFLTKDDLENELAG